MRETIEELRSLLQEKSIQKGRFVLASGDISNYYCDTKATTLSPRGTILVGDAILPIADYFGAEAIGGLAMGALFVSSPAVYASASRERPLYGFAVRQEKKKHGREELIEESYHPDGRQLLCEHRRVLVVDDVITKGGSVLKAINQVRERKCEIVAVVSLVDRKAGGRELLESNGLAYYPLFYTDESGTLHIDETTYRLTGERTPELRAAGRWR